MANEMDSAAGALMHIVHSRPGTPPSEEQQKPIQAYAKLQGEDFVYYVRTLSVLLGRKTSPGDDVQVDLGTSKIISRVHARIEYNFVSRSFEIACLGKNGVFVDGKFITKDSQAVPLETKTLVQIGERWFYFLLPISPIQQSKPLGEELKQRLVEAGAASQPAQPSHSSNSPSATVPNSPADSRAGSPNNEDLPDYRLYADVKPPFSYASLIAQAINSSNDKRLTLSSIYQFITEHYPYYRTAQNGWQNSIRHNLSLNKAFVKMARAEHEPGKGAFWTIDSQYEHLFQSGDSTGSKRRVRPSSKPSKATTSPSGSKESEPEITSPTPQRKRQKPEDNSPEPKKSKPSTPTLGTDKDKDREKEKEGDKEKEKENENENESEKEKEKEKEKEIEKEIENGAKAPSAEPSLEQPDPPQ